MAEFEQSNRNYSDIDNIYEKKFRKLKAERSEPEADMMTGEQLESHFNQLLEDEEPEPSEPKEVPQ